MKLLVFVKQVPATEHVKMDDNTGTMIRTDVDAIVNPLDLHAIEEALRVKEQATGEVDITVASMGPPNAADAVREAIAMGCDNGVLISGREFAGSDTWATAYTLAGAARALGPFDLIFCGERATDGETGQVGPMVGAMMQIPILTYVSRIELQDADTLFAHRAIEGGHEVVRCPLPALASVVKEINEPRLPTLAGKIRARHTEIPVLAAEAIEADPTCLGLNGSPTRVVKILYPKLTRSGEVLSTETTALEDCVDRLIAFLRSAQVL